MSDKIKLTYFNVQGKGETIRLVLKAAQVDYEETKINFPEWKDLKPTTPYGQLPVMNIDGIELAQSGTIVRYLARRHGLAGDGNEGFAQADMVYEHTVDLINAFVKPRFAPTPEEKQKLAEELVQKTLPTWLANSEKLLKQRGGEWFSSNKLTFADLGMQHVLYWISWKDEKAFDGVTGLDERFTMLDKYPLLKANYERVGNLPELRPYLDSRPPASQQTNGWGL